MSSLCVPLVRVSTLYGIDAIISYDRSAVSTTLGLLIEGFILLILAFLLYRIPKHPNTPVLYSPGYVPTMVQIVTGYTAITGLFAIIRATVDTGKPLLVGAAIHNLGEWLILAQLYAKAAHVAFWMRTGFFTVSLVIALILVLPLLPWAVLLEQQFGVIFDYLLAMAFYHLYRNSRPRPGQSSGDLVRADDPYQLRHLWRLGLIASWTHFGQIWTLILGSMNVSGKWLTPMLEGIIIFSAPVTFFHYGWFAITWDRMAGARGVALKDDIKPRPDRVQQPAEYTLGRHSNRCDKTGMLVAIGMGLATILGPAIFLPSCSTAHAPSTLSTPATSRMVPFCSDNDTILGYTVAEAHPDQLQALSDAYQPLVLLSRSHKGNLQYNMYLHADAADSPAHQLVIFERWADLASLKAHLASLDVHRLFDSEYAKSLRTHVQLNGPFIGVEPCQSSSTTPNMLPDPNHVSFQFVVDAPVNNVWRRISDLTNFSWIQGVISSEIVSAQQPMSRKLLFANGQVLLQTFTQIVPDKSLRYTLEWVSGSSFLFRKFQGFIQLSSASESASGSASASASSTPSTTDSTSVMISTTFEPREESLRDTAYQFEREEFQRRIPFLQKLFAQTSSSQNI